MDIGSVSVTQTKPLDENNQNLNEKDALEKWVSVNTALYVSACCVMRIPNNVHSVTIFHIVDSKIPLSYDLNTKNSYVVCVCVHAYTYTSSYSINKSKMILAVNTHLNKKDVKSIRFVC